MLEGEREEGYQFIRLALDKTGHRDDVVSSRMVMGLP